MDTLDLFQNLCLLDKHNMTRFTLIDYVRGKIKTKEDLHSLCQEISFHGRDLFHEYNEIIFCLLHKLLAKRWDLVESLTSLYLRLPSGHTFRLDFLIESPTTTTKTKNMCPYGLLCLKDCRNRWNWAKKEDQKEKIKNQHSSYSTYQQGHLTSLDVTYH